jgi:NodT family efflux transporter outer membrane factor (OMF) lipoprotein
MNEGITQGSIVFATLGVLLLSNACAIGPKYRRPDMPATPAFKEAPPAGWKDAQPSDGVPRGSWWRVYNDTGLDALEGQVSISNQNVLAAEAQFRAARAAVRVTRAGQFPTVTAAPSATFSGTGAASGVQRLYTVPIDVAYQADVWGSIRRSVAANAAVAQASAADLENARLLYQAELAADYFQLHGLDAERQLLDAAVESYEQYAQLTKDRYEGGVASMADLTLAQTQLETARAQLADLGPSRAQFEHAIAVLTGKPPSALSLPVAPAQPPPPVLVGLPSTLLERRPDIAAAERQVAAANEQIGVAKAAFYPSLSFGGSAGSQAAALVDLLTAPTRLWSVGTQLAETLVDAGKRRAQVRLTQAAYDATVAGYRQTVLTGFQQVEDGLAELRILSQEAEIVDRAVEAAQQSLEISTIQYRGGLASYLQVITAQTSLLQSQRTTVDLLTRRLVASVSLIQALGGGWDVSQLPSRSELR